MAKSKKVKRRINKDVDITKAKKEIYKKMFAKSVDNANSADNK